MDTETALQTAESLLMPWAKQTTRSELHRLDVEVAVTDLLRAVRALADARWGYLSAITGLDHPGVPAELPEEQQKRLEEAAGVRLTVGEIEVLYHFCAGAAVVTLRVRVPRDTASVPSICAIIPSAGFFERELSEMLGVTVVGTPDPSHLFLPDDWPDDVYPLRKDFIVPTATA
ncbi:MAG: NADH-quinone oxidoreductase subunit C [Anaerolineae bacterium]|nr:NADH-quinone oxidoreductase subunit C [Anaerolineae bacterium]MDW8099882.1 NADH-quinone oxidoreductase subunit C [Anaerolineae bacterium]